MGKVKDFMSEVEVGTEPTEEKEVSYEEIYEYYNTKEKSFDVDVMMFNRNLLNIIEVLTPLLTHGSSDTNTGKPAEKMIIKCIGLLKLEEDKEK